VAEQEYQARRRSRRQPPELVFSAVDRDDDLIQVPFVDRGRSVAPDTIGKVGAKAVHPFPDRFPADHHTPTGEKVLDIRRAERKAMVGPDRMGDDRGENESPSGAAVTAAFSCLNCYPSQKRQTPWRRLQDRS